MRSWAGAAGSWLYERHFICMKDFPGRWDGGQVWIEGAAAGLKRECEATPGGGGDGVSPVIIGSNDGRRLGDGIRMDGPLTEPVPGGDRPARMALRFRDQSVMYA